MREDPEKLKLDENMANQDEKKQLRGNAEIVKRKITWDGYEIPGKKEVSSFWITSCINDPGMTVDINSVRFNLQSYPHLALLFNVFMKHVLVSF